MAETYCSATLALRGDVGLEDGGAFPVMDLKANFGQDQVNRAMIAGPTGEPAFLVLWGLDVEQGSGEHRATSLRDYGGTQVRIRRKSMDRAGIEPAT
jgi:hypothetical protein